MVMMKGVKAKCRKCGREAEANEYVLDHFYKMMVCPNCIKERKAKDLAVSMQKSAAEQAVKAAASDQRPVGWDEDDDYLQRASRSKGKNTVRAVRIDGERVKFNCPKCKYEIVYNTVKKIPGRCPYCSLGIAGMN